MAITFGAVASASNNAANKATSIAVPYPSGIVAGDILIIAGANTAPDPYSTPSGWSTMTGGNPAASASDLQAAAYWRVATGSESGSVTLGTTTIVATVMACMLRYPGAQSTLRGSASAVSSTASATSVAPALVSGVVGTDMVIRIYCYGDDTKRTVASQQTNVTYPSTGSWNQRLKLQAAPSQLTGTPSGQFPGGLMVVDKLGGTDQPSATAAATGGWNVISIALQEQPVAASPPPPSPRSIMPVHRAAFR